jgi:MFS family permease
MFGSLRVRNYRLFAYGGVISNTGTWMSRIAQDWLVLSISGSSLAVGVVTALQFLPVLLFGLYGGVIADRYLKRPLLFATQTSMCVLSLTLAALTLSGHIQVWHVYVIAFLQGLTSSVDNPARQAFVVELVGPSGIRNAVSLNSANFQTARLVGPAIAGVLVAAAGSGWAFLLNGLSYLAPLIGLLLMRTGEMHPVERVPRRQGQLLEGLRYIAARPELIWTIALVGFIGTFGLNLPIWLSAFAEDVFRGDASTYGLLNTLLAVGAVSGAFLAAAQATARIRRVLLAAIGFGLLEALAALAPDYRLFLVLMVPVGLFSMYFNNMANTSVQLATDPTMRGRVMSVFTMAFVGGTPVGGPIMGWLTDRYGARFSFLTGGLIAAATAAAIGLILYRTAEAQRSPPEDHRPGHLERGRQPAHRDQ